MKVALIFLALGGCTIQGELSENSPKHISCTDLRDGEKFSYKAKNIISVRVGIGAPHSIEFVDDNGVKRFLTSDVVQHFKCIPIQN